MVVQMRPQDVKARLDDGKPTYFLDVRQPEEHAIARIAGSELIPLGEIPQRVGEIAPPDGALVVCYCHHGIRSLSAAAKLEQLGIANVVSMSGGIDAWSVYIDPTVPRY